MTFSTWKEVLRFLRTDSDDVWYMIRIDTSRTRFMDKREAIKFVAELIVDEKDQGYRDDT